MKHSKRKAKLICICSFHSISAFFGGSAVMHPVTSTCGVLRWMHVTVSDNYVPLRKILVDACSPKQSPPSTPFVHAWIQSLIYGSYKVHRLQESSNRNTSYFVCCQDAVETSSPEPKDSVSRLAIGRGPVFSERLCCWKKKEWKLLQNSNPWETNQEQGQSVITREPSNKSKALHFAKTLLGYSHPVK